jgi:Cd2+/Zn2+-exporting ATPase
MTVLVVASPCALVLSIPSASRLRVANAVGARRGILFRGGVAIENLAEQLRSHSDKNRDAYERCRSS